MTENREAIEKWKAALASMGKPLLDILVVDDEDYSLNSTKMQIEKYLKSEVHTADNAEDALEFLKKKSCDLIMVDVLMPKISGLDLVKFIKERWPSQPVVFLTGYDDFPGLREALHQGVMKIIEKPVSREQLCELFPGYGREHETGD